jgi:hypothetical protein
VLLCHLCGQIGHIRPKCPNKHILDIAKGNKKGKGGKGTACCLSAVCCLISAVFCLLSALCCLLLNYYGITVAITITIIIVIIIIIIIRG